MLLVVVVMGKAYHIEVTIVSRPYKGGGGGAMWLYEERVLQIERILSAKALGPAQLWLIEQARK